MLPIFFSSTDAGAPSLNNTAGSLLEVLRACLITGYNARSVSSIVVSSGVATATIATHGYTGVAGKRILISGAPEAGLNGVVQPLSVTTNTVVYSAPGVADGTYTGTITSVRAPLGWAESYTGTNAAIFSRTEPEATAMMLRVVDTAVAPCSATSARWFSVESATGIDTYTGQAPSNAQLANGQYVWKGANSASAKKWAVVGDGRFFYLYVESASAPTLSGILHYFGDAPSYQSVDSYACLVGGQTADTGSQSYALPANQIGTMSYLYGSVWARGSSLLGDAVRAGFHFLNWSGSIGPYGPSAPLGGSFPMVGPVFVSEENSSAGHPVRGTLPGISYPIGKDQALSYDLVTPDFGDGRTRIFLKVGNVIGSTTHVLIDLVGPW